MDFTKLTELNIGGHRLVSLRRASDGKVLWEKRNDNKNIMFQSINKKWYKFSYDDISAYQGDTGTLNYRGASSPYAVQPPFIDNVNLSSYSSLYGLCIYDDKITKLGNRSFYQCSNLSSINCPNVTSIGTYAFHSCSNLSSVILPNLTATASYSFYGCSSLKEITLNNLKSMTGTYAFRGCSSLSSVNFPVLTSMYSANGFAYCSNLQNLSVLMTDQVPDVATTTFNNINQTVSVYIPDFLYDEWSVQTNWASLISSNKVTLIPCHVEHEPSEMTEITFTDGSLSSYYAIESIGIK